MSTSVTTRRRVSPSAKSPAPSAPLPPLPITPAARAAAYADAVMAAVLTLQAQLRDPNTAVSHTAAVAIVDLEKTRMRHDTPVAGTHAPSEMLEPLPELAPLSRPMFAATERSGVAGPAPFSRGEEQATADTWDDFVDQVWDEMQEEADAAGRQVIISQEQAEAFARRIHAELKERAGQGVRGAAAPRHGQEVPATPSVPRL